MLQRSNIQRIEVEQNCTRKVNITQEKKINIFLICRVLKRWYSFVQPSLSHQTDIKKKSF